ncbi:MAG TPA: GNAT family N-acetyltransferase [Anaerolineales bacterium]|nr:GNAT family N-acetyltransferase [Anaerolineales bacterium]
MPVLETPRLIIRPFEMEDLPDVHRLFDVELRDVGLGVEVAETRSERAEWLQWAVLNYRQLARLNQPPYGDRAIVLKLNGEMIGSCGFVPCLMPFEQLPGFGPGGLAVESGRYSPEVGLFYAVSPAHRRRGYASEAAQALVEYAFLQLHLKRIVATTGAGNAASIGVMKRLGMQIEVNPQPEPPWLEVAGSLEYNSPEKDSGAVS